MKLLLTYVYTDGGPWLTFNACALRDPWLELLDNTRDLEGNPWKHRSCLEYWKAPSEYITRIYFSLSDR